MTRINEIENALLQLEGGAFQKLAEEYLFRKRRFANFNALGSQAGTNKTTVGIPDAHEVGMNGVILIAFTTSQHNSYDKLLKDINDCLNFEKLGLKDEEVHKIICCHTCTRITTEQECTLKRRDSRIELIGPKQIAQDINAHFPQIAHDHLGIKIGNGSLCSIKNFIEKEGRRKYATPQSGELRGREADLGAVLENMHQHQIVVLSGNSGCGKTKIALEAAKSYQQTTAAEVLILESSAGHNADPDIEFFLRQAHNTLVIVDDANELFSFKHILEVAVYNPKLKLLITVRNYALDKAKLLVNQACGGVFIEVPALPEAAIKEILRDDYEVKNLVFLEQIMRIAHGNIRLAIMASISARKEGYRAIADAYEILDTYLQTTIDDLPENACDVLSVISAFETCDLSSGDPAFDFFVKQGYTKKQVEDCAYLLFKRSIVDLCERISDGALAIRLEQQNLRDYLIYKSFFVDKILKLKDYIRQCVHDNRDSLIRTLNVLLNTFNNKQTHDFVCAECEAAWLASNDESKRKELMETLYPLLPEYSLQYAKTEVEKAEFKSFFNDPEWDRNYYTQSTVLAILCSAKNSQQFESALPILIECIKKGGERVSDYKNALENDLAIDEDSIEHGFDNEVTLLRELEALYEKTLSENIGISALTLASNYMKQGVIINRHSENGLEIAHLYLSYSDDLARLHEACLTVLAKLSLTTRLKPLVSKFLHGHFNYSEDYLPTDGDAKLLSIDVKAALQLSSSLFDLSVYTDCITCQNLIFLAKKLPISRDRLILPNLPTEFTAYRLFIDRENSKKHIAQILQDWDLASFNRLFSYADSVYDNTEFDTYDLSSSIDSLFSLAVALKDTRISPIDLFECYAQQSTNLPIPSPASISSLISIAGYKEIRSIAARKADPTAKLLVAIDECIPDSDINEETCRVIALGSFESQIPLKAETILRINALSKGFAKKYCEGMIGNKKLSIDSSLYFFRTLDCLDEREMATFFKQAFGGNTQLLRSIFFRLMTYTHFDFQGKVFKFLCDIDQAFINEFIEKAIDLEYSDSNTALARLSCLLADEADQHVLLQALDRLYELEPVFFSFRMGHVFKGSNLAKRRDTKNFIIRYIKKNISSSDKACAAIGIVAEFPEDEREEAIVDIMTFDKTGAFLHPLMFEPSTRSASVRTGFAPQIQKEIDMIERIASLLPSDAHYINHRTFLKRVIASKRAEMDNEKWRTFHERN